MSVQITEQDFYDMRQERDNARTMVIDADIRIAEQAATIARLTAANELTQEDAVQNTYAFNLMLTANKAQAEEIHALKDALTRITHTGVTLGNNQSAWDAWRLCATIANEALK